jgi:hypothetical protein
MSRQQTYLELREAQALADAGDNGGNLTSFIVGLRFAALALAAVVHALLSIEAAIRDHAKLTRR